jgi:hypothetical protein
MNLTKSSAVLVFFLAIASYLSAQDTSRPVTDISRISFSQTLHGNFSSAYMDPRASLPEVYSTLEFKKGSGQKGSIPNSKVTKKAIVRFNLRNTRDSSLSVWFFPGLYFWDIKLYRQEGVLLKRIPSISPVNIPDGLSYRYLTLAAHDSVTIVAELTQARTYLNNIVPRLINDKYLPSFINEFHASNPQADLITYLFCGLLLMLILYSLANFFQEANTEFLYYSGYAFFLGLMLFAKAIYNFHTNKVSFFQEEYLDYVMQSAGHLFYMAFMQKFLATRKDHPFLHKLYNIGIVMLILAMISYTYLHYFSDNFVLQNGIENLPVADGDHFHCVQPAQMG